MDFVAAAIFFLFVVYAIIQGSVFFKPAIDTIAPFFNFAHSFNDVRVVCKLISIFTWEDCVKELVESKLNIKLYAIDLIWLLLVYIYVWNEWCEWVCSLIRRDVWFLRYIWSFQRQDPLDSFTSIGRLKEKWFDDSNFGPLSSIQLFSQHTHQCRCCVFVFHFVVCVSFLEISLSGLFFSSS